VPRTLRHFLDAIKFEHTVFALPFAYVAMVLAAGGWPGWHVLGWVTLAMAGARTLAMSVNRLADRLIDAANPRTAGRHLPRGLLRPWHMLLAAVVSGGLLGLSAWMLNPLCFRLAPSGSRRFQPQIPRSDQRPESGHCRTSQVRQP
jgi:4-hydroxybenzoate polyprenyltransferase